ncbi:hypothetical protein HK097_008520 [Rhizophlyctis rosea]|uniref:Uncharacterized protein n=1 Tax=Rhizophlyctis rosea TaxID=64517 RepID=A0AAD5X115_9FUNG|nr:hypothetical protein HK097_008520 [Rhizophlyctis rosea]
MQTIQAGGAAFTASLQSGNGKVERGPLGRRIGTGTRIGAVDSEREESHTDFPLYVDSDSPTSEPSDAEFISVDSDTSQPEQSDADAESNSMSGDRDAPGTEEPNAESDAEGMSVGGSDDYTSDEDDAVRDGAEYHPGGELDRQPTNVEDLSPEQLGKAANAHKRDSKERRFITIDEYELVNQHYPTVYDSLRPTDIFPNSGRRFAVLGRIRGSGERSESSRLNVLVSSRSGG